MGEEEGGVESEDSEPWKLWEGWHGHVVSCDAEGGDEVCQWETGPAKRPRG